MERTSAADFPAFHSDVGHGCGVIVHVLGQHNALSRVVAPQPVLPIWIPENLHILGNHPTLRYKKMDPFSGRGGTYIN